MRLIFQLWNFCLKLELVTRTVFITVVMDTRINAIQCLLVFFFLSRKSYSWENQMAHFSCLRETLPKSVGNLWVLFFLLQRRWRISRRMMPFILFFIIIRNSSLYSTSESTESFVHVYSD